MHTHLFMNAHLQYYYFYWILNYTQVILSLMNAGSLKLFIRLLRVVFSSQQRLNRHAVNAIQRRHSLPENPVAIVGWLSKHLHILCMIMKNFSGIVTWYSADPIPGILSCSSNISISLIFILNSKIALVFETEMLIWTANEESLRKFGRFFI